MSHALTGETGALLRQHALFTSQDIDEIRARVGAALNEHCLQPSGSALTAHFYDIKANALSVCLLEYGDAVTVETQPAQDFLLVQTALNGRVGITCRDGHWTVRPGCSVVLPSNVPLRLDWAPGSTQMILKVPLRRLHEVYEDLTGTHAGRALCFDREIDLDSVDGRQWTALMHYFSEQLTHPSPLSTLKVRMTEESLMRHLLCAQAISIREHVSDQSVALAPRHLRRAREFMEAGLQQEISLNDIADHCGVSIRSLSRAFQSYYRLSPMQVLRTMRLDRVRAELRRGAGTVSVSEVALHWGCAHLGRFAAAYRARFGEAPQETLRASRWRWH